MTKKQFLEFVSREVEAARGKFPESAAVNCALVEEVGEVSTALMYEPFDNVVKECIQVAAMACRLAVEGDPTMEEFRRLKVHGGGTRYMRKIHIMPNTALVKDAVD